MISNYEDVDEAFNKVSDIFNDMPIAHVWQVVAQVIVISDLEYNIKIDENYEDFDKFLKYLKEFRELAIKEMGETNEQ